jgi:ribosomal protein S21
MTVINNNNKENLEKAIRRLLKEMDFGESAGYVKFIESI